jgi:hypothetical protein
LKNVVSIDVEVTSTGMGPSLRVKFLDRFANHEHDFPSFVWRKARIVFNQRE